MLSNIFSIFLLVVGFGFVIFWHELGHFLAAKWVGIKVEQFAVGMGHALVSFRKGIGWKLGSTKAEYDRRTQQHLEKQLVGSKPEEWTDLQVSRAADELGLGETEYRLSWIPVGGYVKMLGQDDTRPGADAEDPRAFNKKTIGQRMIVVSAGVIMNIILAAILFMVLFLYGFKAPAPVVGNVLPNSPAQRAGLKVGDELVSYDGKPMHDFTKLRLNTALSTPDVDVPLVVRRDGKEMTLAVRPERTSPDSRSFVSLGVEGAANLQGPKGKPSDKPIDPNLEYPDLRQIGFGDIITHVNGRQVEQGDAKKGTLGDFAVLDHAIQQSSPANPAKLTVQRADGKTETISVRPHLQDNFGNREGRQSRPLTIAGMQPRMAIAFVASRESPVYGKVSSGDAVKQVIVHNNKDDVGEPTSNITIKKFEDLMQTVGEGGKTISLVVERNGKTVEPIRNLTPIVVAKKPQKKFGLSVLPVYDENNAVIGDVAPDSAAARAGLVAGAKIQSIDGQDVSNWFDIRARLMKEGAHQVVYLDPTSGSTKPTTLTVDAPTLAALANIRYDHHLALAELSRVRHTPNPFVAVAWGAAETRDLILQFYVTLRQMFGGHISASNLMGPVGIVGAGAQFAFRGTDWLIWFLAMISANLAVVNFLPIPIVDGGLFLFLIIEKIQGKPLSRRAQEFAQIAGLLLIVSVFVFVTYNDISRIWGG